MISGKKLVPLPPSTRVPSPCLISVGSADTGVSTWPSIRPVRVSTSDAPAALTLAWPTKVTVPAYDALPRPARAASPWSPPARVSEASELNATLSISKLPVPVTRRLDAALSPSARETLSTPSETWVRPVKVFVPPSASAPGPCLASVPVPELGPLPLITPSKLPSLAWLTTSPPVPALPSTMPVPLVPDRLPML